MWGTTSACVRAVSPPSEDPLPGNKETKTCLPSDTAVEVPSAPSLPVWGPEGHGGPPHPYESVSLRFGYPPLSLCSPLSIATSQFSEDSLFFFYRSLLKPINIMPSFSHNPAKVPFVLGQLEAWGHGYSDGFPVPPCHTWVVASPHKAGLVPSRFCQT